MKYIGLQFSARILLKSIKYNKRQLNMKFLKIRKRIFYNLQERNTFLINYLNWNN